MHKSECGLLCAPTSERVESVLQKFWEIETSGQKSQPYEWIRGHSRSFKPFVANRFREIHDSSSPSQWRYVSTRENPADLPTRGVAVAELALSEMQWRGPTFLNKEEEAWPRQRLIEVLMQPKKRKGK